MPSSVFWYNWGGAVRSCMKEGGTLASIESKEEQMIVKDKAPNGAWIGLSDKNREGNFTWTNGMAVAYTKWVKGQPNKNGANDEDCVWIRTVSGEWDDISCSRSPPYVCQRDPM